MLFKNVSIAGLAHVDAPHTLTTKEINERLQPTLDRLGIRTDVLGDIAGIHARRLWDADVQASDAATAAARKAMEHGVKKVDVFVKGPGSGRETAIRSLQSAGLEVGSITDVTPQAHNGVRPPKRRRV